MSTFKRLLNLGKGKVKVATRPSPKPAPRPAPAPAGDDLLSDARHAVADAAEAFAETVRPEPGQSVEAATPAPEAEPEVSIDPAQAPTPGTRTDLGGAGRHEPEEPPAPKGPVKRTL
ncbi:MAG: hypothetical protein EP330_04695 [Deltaproteobacteria bacterium]|nr:MAG: hypothetical protein EP330_04695 [Deltaproteobacteria bacterium]